MGGPSARPSPLPAGGRLGKSVRSLTGDWTRTSRSGMATTPSRRGHPATAGVRTRAPTASVLAPPADSGADALLCRPVARRKGGGPRLRGPDDTGLRPSIRAVWVRSNRGNSRLHGEELSPQGPVSPPTPDAPQIHVPPPATADNTSVQPPHPPGGRGRTGSPASAQAADSIAAAPRSASPSHAWLIPPGSGNAGANLAV